MTRPLLLLLLALVGADAVAAGKTLYAAGNVTITEEPEEGKRTVTLDGVPLAWTGDGSDRRGLAPFVLLPTPPVAVAQLGVSNGAAVGAALRSGAKNVVVVEPNGALMNGLVKYAPALTLKGVTRVVDSPAAWLGSTDRRFDLIIMTPRVLGMTPSELSRVKSRLAPGGSAAVWVPLGGYSREGFATLMARFAAIFPHVTLWFGNLLPTRGYALLIGSAAPQRPDVAAVERRLADLAPGGYFIEGGNADSFLSFYLGNERGMAAMTRPARPDGGAPLTFLAPYTPAGFIRSQNLFAWLAEHRAPVGSFIAVDPKRADRLARFFAARTRTIASATLGAEATTAQKIALLDEAATFGADDPHLAVAYYRFAMSAYRSALYGQAAPLLEKAKAIAPALPEIRYALGQTYTKMLRHEKATPEFDALDRLAPGYRQRVRIKVAPPASNNE